jgi:multidrug efflux pump subunit AcrB
MWIVRLALRRPYTFVVMALVIILLGVITIGRMPTDIFPEINIPVVSVIWTFTGMSPDDMEKRIVTISERAMTTTVNDIEHIESQSMQGVSVVKVFFHPGAKIEAAVAQITSIMQTILRVLPPGIQPPLILRYSASNVPILQLGIGSKTLSEQQLYDLGSNFLPRPTGDDPGGLDTVTLRWQSTADYGGSGSAGLAGQGPVSPGRQRCHQRAESPAASR